MRRPTPTEVGFALLLSVPPGLGMTGFLTQTTGGGLVQPGAALAGLATFLVVFSVVIGGVTVGSAGEPTRPEEAPRPDDADGTGDDDP